jgi:hypothetical protein
MYFKILPRLFGGAEPRGWLLFGSIGDSDFLIYHLMFRRRVADEHPINLRDCTDLAPMEESLSNRTATTCYLARMQLRTHDHHIRTCGEALSRDMRHTRMDEHKLSGRSRNL